ncbi:MAG: response regulator [Vicinamibacteria bacterium]|nr:response regulator [Vicinamibacteria bacterium]
MAVSYPRSDTRILVVEDEAIVARDLAHRLEDLGYEVTGTAASGAEALALAQSTRPNLVFMDITIQGPIDGVETAHRLVSRMDVPIIFLTAHTDTGTIQSAKRARSYGYLIKPFDERELVSTIEMAVSRHRSDLPARLLQQAIASAGIGVVMTAAEAEHRITMCNPRFELMSGYPSAEIVGRSPWFLGGDGTSPVACDEVKRALDEKGECRVDCLLFRKDGAPFWADVVVSAVRDSSGEATHSLLCITDVSARKSGTALGG